MAELVHSIKEVGLLQPIVVRRQGEKFQLIAGERRWRAFQQLKIKAIPARIVEASNASSAALGLIENLQREGLNPIEEAHGYASLIRDFDLTQETAADRVGKGRATVANALRLLSLDGELQGFVAKNLLSVGHAKVLLGVQGPRRVSLARLVVDKGLTVRATEALVQAENAPKAAPERELPRPFGKLEDQLSARYGTSVRIDASRGDTGKITIIFRDLGELERVVGLIRG